MTKREVYCILSKKGEKEMKISEKTRNAFLEDLLKAPELWIQTPEQLRVDKEFALQAVGNNFKIGRAHV